MINVISPNSGLATSSYGIEQKASAAGANQSQLGNSVSVESSNNQSLSSLSRLLASSASRLDALDRTQLAAIASKTLSQVINGDWTSTPTGETEIQDSSDKEHLARAKQAAEFSRESVYSGGKTTATKNPFSGLSTEQLDTIAYDDSGTFTVGERRAAYMQAYNIEEAWREKVVAEANYEYNSTGKLTNFYTSALDHYKSLPSIEQVQYPSDYAEKLKKWISMDFNFITDKAEGTDSHTSLANITDKLHSLILLPRSQS